MTFYELEKTLQEEVDHQCPRSHAYCRETFLLAQGALQSPIGGSRAKGREEEPSEVCWEESLLGQERLEGKGLTPHSPQVRAVVSQEELCETRTGWSSLQN